MEYSQHCAASGQGKTLEVSLAFVVVAFSKGAKICQKPM